LLCNQSHEPNTGVKPSDDDEQWSGMVRYFLSCS
jgi:hypothetical protein